MRRGCGSIEEWKVFLEECVFAVLLSAACCAVFLERGNEEEMSR